MAIIGKIVAMTGTAVALSDNGTKRDLHLGDQIQTGDTIQTAKGVFVDLELANGRVIHIAAEQLVAFTPDLTALILPDAQDSALNLATIDTVIKAIEGGKDINEVLEETAAGSNGLFTVHGFGFVDLVRINDVLNKFKFAYDYSTDDRLITEPLVVKEDDRYGLNNPAPALPTPGNAAPGGVVTPAAGNEDGGNIAVNLSGSDTDGTIASVTVTALPPASQGVLYLADGVTPVLTTTVLSPTQAAALVFIPAQNFNGTVNIPFTVTDNQGAVSPVAITPITVTPVNDAPVATDNTNNVPINSTATGNVLIDGVADSDIDGDTLTVTSFSVDINNDGTPEVFAAGSTAVIAGVGTLSIAPNGAYTFIPVTNYSGPVPVATYTINDGSGTPTATDTATLTLVMGTNLPPVAVVTPVSATEDDPSIPVNLSGSDADGAIASVRVTTLPPATQGVLCLADGVTPVLTTTVLSPADAATLVFKPAQNFNGTVNIPFTVTDNNGATSPIATTPITITAVNDAPIATDNSNNVPINGSATGNVLTDGVADSDPENDLLTVTGFSVDTNGDGTPETFAAGAPATITGVGTLTINGNGSYTFTPVANYNGLIPVANYTISDGSTAPALTDTATLTLIMGNNTPPVATDDTKAVVEDTPATGNVLTDGTPDSDPDSNPLTVVGFSIDTNGDGTPEAFTPGQTATIPGVGTLTIAPNGAYTFTPALNYNGPVPVATYAISDGLGGIDSATLTLGPVTGTNDAPLAVADVNNITELKDNTATNLSLIHILAFTRSLMILPLGSNSPM